MELGLSDEAAEEAAASRIEEREDREREVAYAVRFGVICALVMAGVWTLARIPACPNWQGWSPIW